MRYLALACDYDGTLARRGIVAEDTLAALDRLRQAGRKVIVVTGHLLDDLLAILPRHDLFDRIVAENGAVLYRPVGREERLLAEAPPPWFVDRLRDKGIDPLSAGRAITATSAAHDHAVVDVIRQSGLELRMVYNREALMIVPAEVTKGTGLRAALRELGMSPHEVVGIGDAENDLAWWLEHRNLALFVELADGVDDATWLHPPRAARLFALARGSHQRPFVVAKVAEIEARSNLTARYTLPVRP